MLIWCHSVLFECIKCQDVELFNDLTQLLEVNDVKDLYSFKVSLVGEEALRHFFRDQEFI